MELQNNNPVSNVSKSSNKKNETRLIIAVIFVILIFAGLAYTNVLLKRTNDTVKGIESKISEIDTKVIKLEELSKKGASDELLGFDTVDKDGYQSVFLSSGQVYFGKITSMTTENFVLEDVYYLRDNGGNDQSLVKLGCEIHKPEDKLTIIRSNVEFWENLKDKDEKGVVPAILEYKKANPDGQKCS